MLTTKTEHKLSQREAEQIKQAVLERGHMVVDPEVFARSLIAAFRAVEEATQAPDRES